jgi:hypothetical protein
VLGEVVARTYGQVGAMLSAGVKFMRDNDPGAGFYKLAKSKGWLAHGGDRLKFWSGQLAKLYDYYSAQEYDDLRPGRTRRRASNEAGLRICREGKDRLRTSIPTAWSALGVRDQRQPVEGKRIVCNSAEVRGTR